MRAVGEGSGRADVPGAGRYPRPYRRREVVVAAVLAGAYWTGALALPASSWRAASATMGLTWTLLLPLMLFTEPFTEVAPQGLRVRGALRTRTIPWECVVGLRAPGPLATDGWPRAVVGRWRRCALLGLPVPVALSVDRWLAASRAG